MADNIILNAGVGGDTTRAEDVGTSKIPVVKIHTGGAGVDGGPVGAGNALIVDNSAVTQPISAVSLPLPTNASTSALQTTGNTSLSSIDGKLPTAGQKTMSGSQPVAIASDQSTIPVQEKIPNRLRCIFKFQAVAPATADTLLTLTKNLDGTETTGTSFAVTAAKTLRIQSVAFSMKAGAATAAFSTMTLRHLKGTVLIGSPALLRIDLGNTANVIGAADKVMLEIPDGIEFTGTDQIGVSLSAQAVTNVISIQLIGYEYTP